jgi:hypothetical protein
MTPTNQNDAAARQLLRHTLATLAYRAGKVLRDAPGDFVNFRIFESTRTPGQILAHLGDVLEWADSIAKGKEEWHDSPVVDWETAIQRFFAALKNLDARLASNQPLPVECGKIFQGPIADALTHVGQIAMLRRMAGAPVRGENYYRAEIAAGRVGLEQSMPVREFN